VLVRVGVPGDAQADVVECIERHPGQRRVGAELLADRMRLEVEALPAVAAIAVEPRLLVRCHTGCRTSRGSRWRHRRPDPCRRAARADWQPQGVRGGWRRRRRRRGCSSRRRCPGRRTTG
jgi:hypothetical protein